jgi:hypothetical protein
MAGGSKRSRYEAAAAALLSEATDQAAADRAKISLRTLQNWKKEHQFLAIYRQARLALVEAAVTRLQQVAVKAVLALARNLNCGKPAAEIRAAVAVLEHSWRGLEAFDLEARLAALEAAAAARPGRRSSP